MGGLLQLFAAAFTRPTYERFVVLLLAAILTTGSRTILNLLRTVGDLAPGDPSSYHAVIAVFYAELPAARQRQRAVTWRGKAVVTFSDAITAVRRWLWAEWVFATPDHSQAFAKIPRRLQATLLGGLAAAA